MNIYIYNEHIYVGVSFNSPEVSLAISMAGELVSGLAVSFTQPIMQVEFRPTNDSPTLIVYPW